MSSRTLFFPMRINYWHIRHIKFLDQMNLCKIILTVINRIIDNVIYRNDWPTLIVFLRFEPRTVLKSNHTFNSVNMTRAKWYWVESSSPFLLAKWDWVLFSFPSWHVLCTFHIDTEEKEFHFKLLGNDTFLLIIRYYSSCDYVVRWSAGQQDQNISAEVWMEYFWFDL